MTNSKQPVLIGGAWPYANGSLHIGHVAALLPGDVLARYFRQRGHPVLYVSGSDCHGTPIAVRARQDQTHPSAIAARYHQEFCSLFGQLGFSYDCYSRTDSRQHALLVQSVFMNLLDKGCLEQRMVDQAYCPGCSCFLPDRYVSGCCPHCAVMARGDQCDGCTALLSAEDLVDPHCQLCGAATILKTSRHFYLRLSAWQTVLADLLEQNREQYRKNAYQETARYLKEGLIDRAITRDMDWGVPVPVSGYEDKRIYVWVDAVLGYLSASQLWAGQTGGDWQSFWSGAAQSWFVHGKDNIAFHTLLLPALLHGFDPALKKPDHIVSSEYLTIDGQKISTSRNQAIWAADLLSAYPADSIRYYLLANNPEKRDADFSLAAFEQAYKGELLGAFGNLVHRTFSFVCKYRDGCTPNEPCDPEIKAAIDAAYLDCAMLLEKAEIKKALERAFQLVRIINRFFDREQPWKTRHNDPDACDRTLATCLHAIVNLAQLLGPFLPFSSSRIFADLGIESSRGWSYQNCPCGRIISQADPLYPRLEKSSAGLEAVSAHKSLARSVHRKKEMCDNKAG